MVCQNGTLIFSRTRNQNWIITCQCFLRIWRAGSGWGLEVLKCFVRGGQNFFYLFCVCVCVAGGGQVQYLSFREEGWSGGAMVLGKFPVLGRPTNLDYSRARAYCACSRCGWGVVWTFFLSSIISLLSPSLWETARYRLKYCLKGPLSPKQPTNLP